MNPSELSRESEFRALLGGTIELQRDVERAMRLVVNVLRGPDPAMRAEAVEKLEALADEMAASTARLEELR